MDLAGLGEPYNAPRLVFRLRRQLLSALPLTACIMLTH